MENTSTFVEQQPTTSMASIKNLIKSIPLIGNLAKTINQTINPNKNACSYWLNRYFINEPCTIVQIGSNDGKSGDPIYDLAQKNTKSKVLLVEPVPYVFEQLKKNYGSNSRFKFENAGINADGSNQTFYSVSEEAFEKIPNLPHIYNQIGSFDKSHVLKLSEGKIDNYITETEVNCLTLNQLFQKNEISDLDILHVDAEGYDWKVLSQLDLKKFKPTIILFEFFGLKEEEKSAAIDFLKEDYYLFAFRIDFLCIKKDKIREKDLKTLGSKLKVQ